MMPQKKVAAGGLAGALSVLLLWGLSALGVAVSAEAGAALATIVGFAVAYMVPGEEKSEDE